MNDITIRLTQEELAMVINWGTWLDCEYGFEPINKELYIKLLDLNK